MSVECVVVDAGARYGLHPTWSDLREIASFHLFEIDPAEAERLTRKYQNNGNVTVYPVGLFREDTTLSFTVSEHKALNSLFAPNEEFLGRSEYMTDAFATVGVQKAPVRALDSLFASQPVHFMKLDVEGAEFDILSGAPKTLERSVLGVRAEVLFSPVYKDAPLFGDVHKLLLSHGFELLNLDYNGAGNKGGRFTLPDRYGKLISSDAVWILNSDRRYEKTGDALRDDIIRLSVFLMSNGATDLAIETLDDAVSRRKISFEAVKNDPLFRYLHRRVLLLLKSLMNYPMLGQKDITDVYQRIFGLEFPTLNKFYESDLFT